MLRLGRPEEAIPPYQEALRLDPTLANAHYNIGTAFERLGRHQEAMAEFEQVLRLEPASADARTSMGAVLEKLGRVSEAVDHYEVSLRPLSPPADILEGDVLAPGCQRQHASVRPVLLGGGLRSLPGAKIRSGV